MVTEAEPLLTEEEQRKDDELTICKISYFRLDFLFFNGVSRG